MSLRGFGGLVIACIAVAGSIVFAVWVGTGGLSKSPSIQGPSGSRYGKIAPKVSFTDQQGHSVKPVCNETTHESFYIRGSGLTFNGNAQYVILYPINSAKRGAPYTYIQDYGLVTVDGSGSFTTKKPWECWLSPGGGGDPTGIYRVMVIDETWPDTWYPSPALPFHPVK